jgi:hypothetical protein
MLTTRSPIRRLRSLLLAATVAAGLGAFAAQAHAGQWMQVSCANPGGSAAPSEGWTSFTTGSPGYASNSGTNCTGGGPMYAILSTDAVAPVGTSEVLQYTPPTSSTLAGGTVDVSLSADGTGYNASGTAVLYTPAFAYAGSNVFFQCAAGLSPCLNGTNDFSGTVALPANRGGDLYVAAGCGGNSGAVCNSGGSGSAWASTYVYSADLLLDNSASPTGTGFAGTLLQPDAHGTATLTFTAADPNGPGVYEIIVQIDGKTVYDATPDTNGGECAPVGTDSASGALMFDWQQPCPLTDAIDIPVDTTALADGTHELTVAVEDAAQNTSTVLDQSITTANLTTVSSLLPTPPSASTSTSPTYAFALGTSSSALKGEAHRTYDQSALPLSGTLENAAGVTAPGVTVALWASPADSSHFTEVAHTTTDGTGAWSLHAPRGPSRVLRVVAGAGARPSSSASAVSVTETVTPSLSLRVGTPSGARLVFTGRLAISPLGTPRPLVLIEVRAASGWQAVGEPVRVAADGRYRYAYPSSTLLIGHRFAFRATTPATSLWQTGLSRTKDAVLR